LDDSREILRQSFLAFRSRVADLVSTIGSELPNLTVHDITHLDALWRVADEIAGDAYPLNPAEAYVLGGAFLLHDAAHVLAAYPGGIAEIKQTLEWQDLVAQRRGGVDPQAGSADEKLIIFQVLRHLHADQAHKLPYASWRVDQRSPSIYLIDNYELRDYYGDLIGQVAASHHWAPSKVAAEFAHRRVSCPAILAPARWEVDALKVALLLRTADAAHLDAQRAPWFLFSLRQPEGVSAEHWRFQAKIGQPSRTANGELRFTSGSVFPAHERGAWWLAFDTARMVDRELHSAHEILQEENRPLFAATRVLGVESASSFARLLPVRDWEPVDVAPRIGNVPRLIANLGGAALYGEGLAAPLRELLQNGLDAVSALRALGSAEPAEGSIHVGVRTAGDDDWWLEVTDSGVGMSRHVLTNVLLDFGASLWSSDIMREELPGLAKAGFRSIGKFGIGFFAVFMLGDEVRVTTRRYEPSRDGSAIHWQLRFENGLGSRPALVQPSRTEMLQRHGTRIAVRMTDAKVTAMFETLIQRNPFASAFEKIFESIPGLPVANSAGIPRDQLLALLVGRLCPCSDVKITTQMGDGPKYLAVNSNDWLTLPDASLLGRVGCAGGKLFPLTSRDGMVLGKLGVPSSVSFDRPGSITYQGIACGEVKGLQGVVKARENNSDARRTKAIPGGTLDDWQRWAQLVLDGVKDLDLDRKKRLHVLRPELDLAVWTTEKGTQTLDEVVERSSSAEEFILLEGDIDHKESDPVGSDMFSSLFKLSRHAICIPSYEPLPDFWALPGSNTDQTGRDVFPWFTGVSAIDYLQRFEAALERRWGGFEVERDTESVVGDVNGTQILRLASKYTKA